MLGFLTLMLKADTLIILHDPVTAEDVLGKQLTLAPPTGPDANAEKKASPLQLYERLMGILPTKTQAYGIALLAS